MSNRVKPGDILNAILPSEWLLKAMRAKYRHCGEPLRHLVSKPVRRTKAQTVKIDDSSHGKAHEPFTFEQLWKSGNCYTLLSSHCYIWIRGTSNNDRKRLFDICMELRIEFARAKAKIRRHTAPDFDSWESWGVVVKVCDACAVLTRYKPGILERKRSAVYDCDEH